MSEDESPVDFFISYTGADTAWAKWVDWQLRDAGYSTLIQAYDFGVGGNFVLDMQRALERASRVVAVWSAAYFKSRYCAPEIAAAFVDDPDGKQRRLLPVRVEAVRPPKLWRAVQYVDFVGQSKDDCASVLLNAANPPGRPPSSPPFPGAASGAQVAKGGLPARFPGSPPAIWNVPYSRNIHFTGRDAMLERLHQQLSSGQSAALTQAVKGLGGVGKTQLALEYAYRYGSDYEGVWWLHAEDPDGLRRDYVALAKPLELPEAQDEKETVESVRNVLARRPGILLVFDNAPDAKVLEPYAPQGDARRVLITSRAQYWPNAQSADVDVMTLSEATQLLLESCRPTSQDGTEADEDDVRSAEEVAELVGALPLALGQAAAYVQTTGVTLRKYATLLREHGLVLVGKGQAADYNANVLTTWDLAMARVAAQNEAAASLLKLCSFFAPDDIWLSNIASGAEDLPEPLRSCVADELEFNEALALLRSFSLIGVDEERLSCHRLVQWVTRERLSEMERAAWRSAARWVVRRAFPEAPAETRTWATCARLLPHVRSVVSFDSLTHADADLLGLAGHYLLSRARYAEAEPLMRRALSIDEASYGAEHPEVATGMNNLAQLLKDTNRLDEAEPLMRRALSIDVARYGAEHPEVAAVMNNLALLLQDTNRLDEAEPLLRNALKINEATYGADHPNVATSLNNLAVLLQDTNRLDEAALLLRKAISINEATYGANHPSVAIGLNNLALLLQDMNRLDEAEPLLRRALSIDETCYGGDHPIVAKRLSALGHLLKASNRLGEAEPLMRRALSVDEMCYGASHPWVARRLNNLALLLRDTNCLDEAELLLRRAINIHDKSSTADHSAVATNLTNLAVLLRETKRSREAEPLLRRALSILQQGLGPDHPHTQSVLRSLGG